MTAQLHAITTPDKITHSIVIIDAAMAQRWLDQYNTRNRPISKARVQDYATEMLAGRWHFNGETIQFDRDGVLLNGQHRLLAIVATGLAQTFLIVRGLDPATQVTIDQGTKRLPHEQLIVSGVLADNTMAAAIRVYIQWSTGRLFGDQIRNKVPTGEVVQWAHANMQTVETLRAINNIGLRRIYGQPSVTLAVALRLVQIDSWDAEQFLSGLRTGAGLDDDSPVLALRERLRKAKESDVRLSVRDVIGMYVTAWNAVRGGRAMRKIQRPRGGVYTAQNFPTPR